MRGWRWLGAALALAAGGPAHADELRPGYLELRQTSAARWTVTLKAPVKGGMAANATPVLPAFCRAGTPERRAVPGALLSIWAFECGQPLAGREVGLDGLDRTIGDALVRIAPLGQRAQAARLTAAEPRAIVAARAGRGEVAATYFSLGVEHILSGYDHLLFVLSLVLLLGTGWAVARTVTAFTIAHSITLAGATLGVMGVSQRPVEICIALSIVFLAVEVVKRDPSRPRLSERLPWLVAFLFGLLHGFGFAGALAEIGMPEGEVPVALLAFNLGVEAGQLAVVALALGVLALIARAAPAWRDAVRRACAYPIGIMASFWLVERIVG